MTPYDVGRFEPPAPIATVSFRDPQTGAELTAVELLVDSGADVTVVPRLAIERLGTQVVDGAVVELSGFDGSRSVAPVVALEMRFSGLVFRGRFPVADQAVGVLGRNVLNSLVLSLDGPQLAWGVGPPSSQPPR